MTTGTAPSPAPAGWSESTRPRPTMKALAVVPGRPGSVHLRDVPMPRVEDMPDGRGVLVRVLRVGVDGTDKEINAAEYGMAPPGDDFLVLGHETNFKFHRSRYGYVTNSSPLNR